VVGQSLHGHVGTHRGPARIEEGAQGIAPVIWLDARMHALTQADRRLRGWSWPRGYPIAQFPNPPLIIGLVALGIRYAVPGAWADAFAAIGYVFVAVWAGCHRRMWSACCSLYAPGG